METLLVIILVWSVGLSVFGLALGWLIYSESDGKGGIVVDTSITKDDFYCKDMFENKNWFGKIYTTLKIILVLPFYLGTLGSLLIVEFFSMLGRLGVKK